MLEVYLFNPDNDLALANGDENYTPPLSARKMADDLSLLPIWYTSPGMLVMSNEPDADEWILQIKNLFNLSVGRITEDDIAFQSSLKLCPWGWNAALIKQARTLGFSDDVLPDKKQMEILRELSHRSLAVSLLKELIVFSSFPLIDTPKIISIFKWSGYFYNNIYLGLIYTIISLILILIGSTIQDLIDFKILKQYYQKK